MFKSIKWKIAVMFVLMVTSVILIVGTFFRISISNYYTTEFKNSISETFAGDFMLQLQSAANDENSPTPRIGAVIDAYSGRLGADVFRTVYLLDGKNASVLYSTDVSSSPDIEKTPNIISAISGQIGNEAENSALFMDYAVPIVSDSGEKYIVYVHDTKEELGELTSTILTIILQSLLFGLAISFLLGYFMSKTITLPIISLTRKAERMRAGDFETLAEVKADDEIGELTNTFNLMSTRLKETLTEIEGEKNKIETILMFMNDGVIAFGNDGTLIHVNYAAKRILQKQNFENVNFDNLFGELGVDISIGEIMYSSEDSIHRETVVGDVHTSIFFASTASQPGFSSAIIAVIRDVTEQHRLEMSRREFVSNVSHELRTPITTIKSYIETIMDSPGLPQETLNNFLSVALKESDRMSRLVYDLLELSRFDCNRAGMDMDYFDLKALITEIGDKLSFELDACGHETTISFAGNIPPFYGNRDRIEQVITNIITNASKYTPGGGRIMISAGTIYDSIYVKVKDTGIGIPEEDLPYIFDRFYRVDKARSRSSGGTGLGLAIAKEIVTAHGGSIKVTSEKGKGSEFILNFPCKKDVTLS